jgi:hypothetical protein
MCCNAARRALAGHSMRAALDGIRSVRDGVLTAVESILVLDHEYRMALACPDAQARTESGELRPDWRKRGFLRGYTDNRYTFGRYLSPADLARRRRMTA